MGAAGSISMTTGPREDARVKLEWSSSGARVKLEWSSSGARVELDHLGHSLSLQQLWVLPNFGSSHTRILSTQCMRMYLQLVGCRPSCGCRDVSAPCAPIIMCCVVIGAVCGLARSRVIVTRAGGFENGCTDPPEHVRHLRNDYLPFYRALLSRARSDI